MNVRWGITEALAVESTARDRLRRSPEPRRTAWAGVPLWRVTQRLVGMSISPARVPAARGANQMTTGRRLPPTDWSRYCVASGDGSDGDDPMAWLHHLTPEFSCMGTQ
jgi:hypothetical protein